MIEEIWIHSIFGKLVGWLVGLLLQRWTDTKVSLAFEDAQVIQPFSREETDDTDDRDDKDDTDDTDIFWIVYLIQMFWHPS